MHISSNFLEKCLDKFGVEGKTTPLPGEIDFNYLVHHANGKRSILKVSPYNFNENELDFQEKMLNHLELTMESSHHPKMYFSKNGKKTVFMEDDFNQKRAVRMLNWIDGDLWSSVSPITDELLYSLGVVVAKNTTALIGFNHFMAERSFDWNLDSAEWTENHITLLDPDIQSIALTIIGLYKKAKQDLAKLRKSVIHNDANDNNIIVHTENGMSRVLAIIDFGDAVYAAIANDVAVTVTYAVMGLNEPLSAACHVVKGYHQSFALVDEELKYLHLLVSMRLIISLTKSALNLQQSPENKYLQISSLSAQDLLIRWQDISPDLAYFSFRAAIGLSPHPNQQFFKDYLENHKVDLKIMFPSVGCNAVSKPDMSVESTFLGHHSEFDDVDKLKYKLNLWKKNHPHTIPANGYLEIRPFYSTESYKKEGNNGPEYRTVHLGVDYWLEAGTPVHTPISGIVHSVFLNEGYKNYGPTIIIRHETDSITFYTLYGHLSTESLHTVTAGQSIEKGAKVGYIGDHTENGGWVSHLHFQIILDMMGYHHDFPGVTYYNNLKIWKSICPDPHTLFTYFEKNETSRDSLSELQIRRKDMLGNNLSLSYRNPLKIMRGDGVYLIDHTGRKYLDTVNNVAHVGHEHRSVIKAGAEQMAVLNTNTRYLHDNILLFAEKLLSTLPEELKIVFFVNSGSEANELALRMAYTFTKQRDIIALQTGYHGNTNGCINISSYKFESLGGPGKPAETHLIPLPDTFRGLHRAKNTGHLYAKYADEIIHNLSYYDKAPAAFIHESIVSCGGQIMLPDGFLKDVYTSVHRVGGLCIADEVQTGLGRVGAHWWSFQHHEVIPDIVTIGKPLGNGHPLAAVACTKAVADAFANGLEYFNTFGGNPVSCAIGMEVLNVIQKENLIENAKQIGSYLMQELKMLQGKYPIIGDVRGLGLFLGFELIDQTMRPLPVQTAYLSNRMKELGILTSTDGPDHNVIKIKPPLCFNSSNADEFLMRLAQILKEKQMTV